MCEAQVQYMVPPYAVQYILNTISSLCHLESTVTYLQVVEIAVSHSGV